MFNTFVYLLKNIQVSDELTLEISEVGLVDTNDWYNPQLEECLVFLIPEWQKYMLPKESLHFFDVTKTGDAFQNKICNVCHKLLPTVRFAKNQNGINKLLRKYLPKGKEYKRARDIIYDEKNIFLNAGCKKSDNKGIRKSDGRMTYQQNMSDILDIVAEWVSTSQVAIDLYDMFYNLNEKYGYGHEVYDESSTKYNKAKVNEKGAE